MTSRLSPDVGIAVDVVPRHGRPRLRPAAAAVRAARVIQVADSGVATAAVGIPQRNMHTQVEIVSLDDMERTIRLLVEFVGSIRPDTDLRPINFDG